MTTTIKDNLPVKRVLYPTRADIISPTDISTEVKIQLPVRTSFGFSNFRGAYGSGCKEKMEPKLTVS
jgi:hypothetical protein